MPCISLDRLEPGARLRRGRVLAHLLPVRAIKGDLEDNEARVSVCFICVETTRKRESEIFIIKSVGETDKGGPSCITSASSPRETFERKRTPGASMDPTGLLARLSGALSGCLLSMECAT